MTVFENSFIHGPLRFLRRAYSPSLLRSCGRALATWSRASRVRSLLSSYAANRSHAHQSVFFKNATKTGSVLRKAADAIYGSIARIIGQSAVASIAGFFTDIWKTRAYLLPTLFFTGCAAGYLAMTVRSGLESFSVSDLLFPVAVILVTILLNMNKGITSKVRLKETIGMSAVAHLLKTLILPTRSDVKTANMPGSAAIPSPATVPSPVATQPPTSGAFAVSCYALILILGVIAGAIGYGYSVKLLIAAAAALIICLMAVSDHQRVVYLAALYVLFDWIIRQVVKSGILAGIWDELFLFAALFVLLLKWFATRRGKAYSPTPLDFPLLFFFGTGLFLLIAAAPDLRIGIEGLRAVAQYMLWFFVASRLLRTNDGGVRLMVFMAVTGLLLALHGLYQYAVGAEMPSGWVDAAEKGVRTRAYSIIGSPNILGSLMVITTPIALAFAFGETKPYKKFIYFCAAAAMVLCLVVTFSRSAWLGFAFSMLVFFMMKDKRRYLTALVLAGIILFLIPPVYDRMQYMLSGDYITSSIRGGRLQRWPIGLKMLSEHPLFGVGLGQFGGAVAANNNIPGTFYMDNYFLKTAVEMGIVGLSAFVLLIYNAVIWTYRSIRYTVGKLEQQLTQGIFAAVCGMVIPNFFENVFEVPMMVTYFWLLAAAAMFFGYINGTANRGIAGHDTDETDGADTVSRDTLHFG